MKRHFYGAFVFTQIKYIDKKTERTLNKKIKYANCGILVHKIKYAIVEF